MRAAGSDVAGDASSQQHRLAVGDNFLHELGVFVLITGRATLANVVAGVFAAFDEGHNMINMEF